MLDFERPEHSTEPEKEPWSQPPSGYKWYDPTTFKAGSYGGEKGADPQPNTQMIIRRKSERKVSFDIPQNVSVNEPFEVTIYLKGFEANQTLENLRVGIYKEGGRQIGQFSSKDNDYNQPGLQYFANS